MSTLDLPRAPGSADDLALLTGADAAGLLAAALATVDAELLSARPRQVVHRPGVDTTVGYRARVRWAGGREVEETLAAATPVDGRDEGGGALVLQDGATRVAVWRFPDDPALPGLAQACDPQAVAGLLERFGLGSGPVRLRTRAYRPRRRAVIEAIGPRGRLFLKVVRPHRVEGLHDRHRALVAAGVPAAPSLGWTADGVVVQQCLPGSTLRQALRSRTSSVPSGRDLLAVLARLPADLADEPPRPSWVDNAGHYAGVVGASVPDEAGRATALAASIVAEAGPSEIGPVHGDLHEGQVLVHAGRVCGLLDVDTAGAGDVLDDRACLLGHLAVLAQIDRRRSAAIGRAARAYLVDFDAVAPDAAARAALRHRVAAVVLSLATGPHRVQEPGWAAATRRRLDLAAAWHVDGRATAAVIRRSARPSPDEEGLTPGSGRPHARRGS
jgi:hypothetical protein